MGKLVGAVTTAALLGCGVLCSCGGGPPAAGTPVPSAQSSNSTAAQEAAAIKVLRAWLAHPLPGSLTVSGVDTNAANKMLVSRRLLGTCDLTAGTASLTGTRTSLTATSTNESPQSALMMGGQVFTSIDADQSALYPGRKWLVHDLAAARADGSVHSVWWVALSTLDSVHVDGPSEIDGKSSIEYTGTVDLAKAASTAKIAAASDIFRKAGTSKVSIDIYTDLGTGDLVSLTYRLGLKVSVDAVATGSSTAGYEVDLGSFGGPTTSPSPVTVPGVRLVARGGSDDLYRLLPF